MERKELTSFLQPSQETHSNIKHTTNSSLIRVFNNENVESYEDNDLFEKLDIHHISKADLNQQLTEGLCETLASFDSIANKNDVSKAAHKHISLNIATILRDYSNLNIHLSNDENDLGSKGSYISINHDLKALNYYSSVFSSKSYKMTYMQINSKYKENILNYAYTALMYDSYFFYDKTSHKAILTENYRSSDGLNGFKVDLSKFDHIENYVLERNVFLNSERNAQFKPSVTHYEANKTCLGDLWGKYTNERETQMISHLVNYSENGAHPKEDEQIFESKYSIVKSNEIEAKGPVEDIAYEHIEFTIPESLDDETENDETHEIDDEIDEQPTLYQRATRALPHFDELSHERQEEIYDILRNNPQES